METSDFLSELMVPLKAVKAANSVYDMLEKQLQARDTIMKNQEKANALSSAQRRMHKRILTFLSTVRKNILEENIPDGETAFSYVKQEFDGKVAAMKEAVSKTSGRIHHLFEFANAAFEEGNEMLVLVTELTVNASSSRYISMFGCEDYQKYNQLLMVSERKEDLRDEIEKLIF